RTVLHPIFDPNNANGWPVKGLIGGDIDNDGYPEIITAADVVRYPYGSNNKRPFPGAIYIDLNEDYFQPQPLIWGKWGEKISNDSLAIIIPKIIDPKFRNSTNTLPDILIATGTEVDGKLGSRVFILEQPPDGFGKYNYTFITPTLRGVEPYETEPFYVKHFYIVEGSGNNTVYREMIFSPNDVDFAETAMTYDAEPIDFNNDGLMDLVVTVDYYIGDRMVRGRIYIYQRISSTVYPYLFKEIQCIDVPSSGFEFIRKANLDGNPLNGKESLVVGFYYNGTASDKLSGPAYLTWNGTLFNIHYLYSELDPYPYSGVYGQIVVSDVNKDGYDDVVIYVQRREFLGGDLVLFLNTGENYTGSHFVYSSDYVKILMKGQWLTWFIALEQADTDPQLELVVCLLNELPYWCPLGEKIRSAYYTNIFDIIE
ncbi:MAG: hypothetical protein ACP6IQ_10505, partial [Candidatus Njordarchaeia archaeon]